MSIGYILMICQAIAAVGLAGCIIYDLIQLIQAHRRDSICEVIYYGFLAVLSVCILDLL